MTTNKKQKEQEQEQEQTNTMGRKKAADSDASWGSDDSAMETSGKQSKGIPTSEDLQERLNDFQSVLLENMPSSKEIKSQQKVMKKSYKRLVKTLDQQEWLDHVEDSTNLPRLWLFWISMFFMGILTVLSFFVKFMGLFMTRFVTFPYPVYNTIKILISEKEGKKSEIAQWVMYWVIYGFFALFEQVAIKQSKVLPVYFSIKIVVLLWAQFLGGSSLLYKILVKPFAIAYNAVFGQ